MLTIQQKLVVIEIYFMFRPMILRLCRPIARAYTLASTVGPMVQYRLRNQENPHISVRHSVNTKVGRSINC